MYTYFFSMLLFLFVVVALLSYLHLLSLLFCLTPRTNHKNNISSNIDGLTVFVKANKSKRFLNIRKSFLKRAKKQINELSEHCSNIQNTVSNFVIEKMNIHGLIELLFFTASQIQSSFTQFLFQVILIYSLYFILKANINRDNMATSSQSNHQYYQYPPNHHKLHYQQNRNIKGRCAFFSTCFNF